HDHADDDTGGHGLCRPAHRGGDDDEGGGHRIVGNGVEPSRQQSHQRHVLLSLHRRVSCVRSKQGIWMATFLPKTIRAGTEYAAGWRSTRTPVAVTWPRAATWCPIGRRRGGWTPSPSCG